jgi:hypothetical protein
MNGLTSPDFSTDILNTVDRGGFAQGGVKLHKA